LWVASCDEIDPQPTGAEGSQGPQIMGVEGRIPISSLSLTSFVAQYTKLDIAV